MDNMNGVVSDPLASSGRALLDWFHGSVRAFLERDAPEQVVSKSQRPERLGLWGSACPEFNFALRDQVIANGRRQTFRERGRPARPRARSRLREGGESFQVIALCARASDATHHGPGAAAPLANRRHGPARALPGSLSPGSAACLMRACAPSGGSWRGDEGGGFTGVTLVVASEAPTPADSCERPLNDPAFREHNKSGAGRSA